MEALFSVQSKLHNYSLGTVTFLHQQGL